jgi:hypothetical protein
MGSKEMYAKGKGRRRSRSNIQDCLPSSTTTGTVFMPSLTLVMRPTPASRSDRSPPPPTPDRHAAIDSSDPSTPAPITNTPAPNEGRPCWWALPPPTSPNTPAPVPPKLTPSWALARSHREQQPHEPHHEHCVSLSVGVQGQEGCGWHELTGAWRSRQPCPPPARRGAPAPPSPPSPPPP